MLPFPFPPLSAGSYFVLNAGIFIPHHLAPSDQACCLCWTRKHTWVPSGTCIYSRQHFCLNPMNRPCSAELVLTTYHEGLRIAAGTPCCLSDMLLLCLHPAIAGVAVVLYLVPGTYILVRTCKARIAPLTPQFLSMHRRWDFCRILSSMVMSYIITNHLSTPGFRSCLASQLLSV